MVGGVSSYLFSLLPVDSCRCNGNCLLPYEASRMAASPPFLLQLEHSRIELLVLAPLVHQHLVRPPFDDLFLLEHHDDIGVLDGGQPVCDDKDRPSMHQGIHALLDYRLCPGIDAAGCLIKDEYRRVGDDCTGYGDQLSLSL